jgi:hypothetical protein
MRYKNSITKVIFKNVSNSHIFAIYFCDDWMKGAKIIIPKIFL